MASFEASGLETDGYMPPRPVSTNSAVSTDDPNRLSLVDTDVLLLSTTSLATTGSSPQTDNHRSLRARLLNLRDDGYRSDESTGSSPTNTAGGHRRTRSKRVASNKRPVSAQYNHMFKHSVEPKSGSSFFGRAVEIQSSDDEEQFVYKHRPQKSANPIGTGKQSSTAPPAYKALPGDAQQGNVYLAMDTADDPDDAGEADDDSKAVRASCCATTWKYCRRYLVYCCMCWGCFAIVAAIALLSYTLFMLPLQTTLVTIKNISVPRASYCETNPQCHLTFDLTVTVTNRNQQSVDIKGVSLTTYVAYKASELKSTRWDSKYSTKPTVVGGEDTQLLTVRVQLELNEKGINVESLNENKFLIRTGGILYYQSLIVRDRVIDEAKYIARPEDAP